MEHFLTECYRCHEYSWNESMTELLVEDKISGVKYEQNFCPQCCDVVERRSRHQLTSETTNDGSWSVEYHSTA